jgi:hypothetical protein
VGTKTILVIAACILGAILLAVAVAVPVVLLTRSSQSASSSSYVPPLSSAGRLLVLVDSSTTRDDGSSRIVARSYDGNPWEAYPDQDYPPVNVSCDSSNTCTVTTPGSYSVTELPVPPELLAPAADSLAARLFIQGTFGASRSDLQDFAATYGGDPTAWVLAQQAMPYTSHRAYLRKRINLRQQFPTCMPICPTSMGLATQPCEVGSRWNNYLFTSNDLPGYPPQTSSVVVTSDATAFSLTINGALRGQVSSFLGNVWGGNSTGNITFPATLVICKVEERVGGNVQLSFLNGSCPTATNNPFKMLNPAITFDVPDPTMVQPLAPNEATFVPVVGTADSVILQSLTISCGITPAFVSYNGKYWQFDPQLKLLSNTLQSPTTGGTVTATVGCPSPAKDFSNGPTCVRAPSCSYFESCGSANEVANDPTLGTRFLFSLNNATSGYGGQLQWQYPTSVTKSLVWLNAVYSAPDKLRQRVAWALAQIVTLSATGLNFDPPVSEPYAQYFDIFVRNAFGNYRDILREVTYSPSMAQYLTYYQNQAFAVAGSYPDENYAREIMQLFAIGLWKLNNDGTQVLDNSGAPIATYTNDDILTFARLWTGFLNQASRSNIESPFGKGDGNYVDYMAMNPAWRDNFPKAQLDEGYLGDRYPLCDQLPPQHWLKPGAQYIFTGNSSVEGPYVDAQSPVDVGKRGRLTPSSAASSLFRTLCAADGTGRCTYPSQVKLTQALTCDGEECNAGRVIAVRMIDPLTGVSSYYTYQSVPCVRLPFVDQGRVLKSGSQAQCANPASAISMPMCCSVTRPTSVLSNYTSECLVANEATNYATAVARCTALGQQVCTQNLTTGANWGRTCAPNYYVWTTGTCALQVQVYIGGQVSSVMPVQC